MNNCRICTWKTQRVPGNRGVCFGCDGESRVDIHLDYLAGYVGVEWWIVQQETVIGVTVTGFDYSRDAELENGKPLLLIRARDDQGRKYTVNAENIGRALFFTQTDAAAYIEQKERVRHEPVNQKAILDA